MPTHAEQRQTFLSEVSNQGTDILALDLTTVWKKRRGDQPLLYGLRTHWQREQVTQAAPRALKAAVVQPIALDTEAERAQLITQLLTVADDVTDTTLIAWLHNTSSDTRRLLLEHIETRFPHINSVGYRAIASEAARIGWPKFYQEDLAIDLNVLCSVGAPKEFWWGVRSTGTDLFLPNTLTSMEWALAREKHESEQRHYHFTGTTLHSITLQTLIGQLARSLNSRDYEQRWQEAVAATSTAGEGRFRTFHEQAAYQQAVQAALQAEKAYRRVLHLKQHYHA